MLLSHTDASVALSLSLSVSLCLSPSLIKSKQKMSSGEDLKKEGEMVFETRVHHAPKSHGT